MVLLSAGLLLAASADYYSLSLDASSFEDLGFLKDRLSGKQVVQLGEATHGGSEFYRLKHRLVRFLHEKLGYDLLVFEAGVIETDLSNLKRDALTAAEWLDSTLFANMRWTESKALFDYLKARPKLQVAGIDPQFSSDEVLTLSAEVVETYDHSLAGEIRKRMGEGYAFQGLTGQPEVFRAKRDEYLAWLRETVTKLEKVKVKAPDTEKFAVLLDGFKGLKRYWNYEPNAPMFERLALRDQMMAEAALKRIGNRKAIVWAHNGHIGKGLGYKILGDHLREKLGAKTYALGLFGRSGSYYQHWTRTTLPWQTDPSGLESAFPSVRQAHFADARSFPAKVKAMEPENGGTIEFVPAERFDGLIVVNGISAPTKG